MKSRSGTVERLNDSRTAIVKNLFKKETNIEVFQNMKVSLQQTKATESGDDVIYLKTPVSGYVEGNFGQSGKCKVILDGKRAFEFCDLF